MFNPHYKVNKTLSHMLICTIECAIRHIVPVIMQLNLFFSPRSSPPIPVGGAGGLSDADKFAVGSPEGSNPPIEVIPDIMPVEEAAEHLELPAQGDGKARKKSGDESFYFYQGKDMRTCKSILIR